MIGRIFVFRSAVLSCGGCHVIFTCVGFVFPGDCNSRISKVFCRSMDRQKLHHSTEERLYVLKSDTGRIRLLSVGELKEQTVDVTEKVDKKVFERFYPGEVMVYRAQDDSGERGTEINGSRRIDGVSRPLEVGTVSYRCLDGNFRLHVRMH